MNHESCSSAAPYYNVVEFNPIYHIGVIKSEPGDSSGYNK